MGRKIRKKIWCDTIKRKIRRIFLYAMRRVDRVVNNRGLSADYAARVTMVNVFNRSCHVPSSRPMLCQQYPDPILFKRDARNRKRLEIIRVMSERERALSIDLSLCGKCI